MYTYLQYTAQTGREFFLDVHQKNLTHLRLKLTDKHNRDIRDTQKPNQVKTGNMNFSAVIRVDIIKRKDVQRLETQRAEPNIPARFSNGIVNQQRNGKDMFNVAPGYQ